MALLDFNLAGTGPFGFIRGFGCVFAWALNTVTEWNDIRVSRKTLNSLTDRELADIGFYRGQIDDLNLTR